MKKRNPKSRDGPRPSEQFKKFEQTMRRLLAVSKKELDELLEAERKAKRSAPREHPDPHSGQ